LGSSAAALTSGMAVNANRIHCTRAFTVILLE